MLRNYLFYEGK
uniref:Uncharacterized protein n=1 Tax=Rhizophora mucronata TaxID=61149 RepID=A0A2P2PXI6_RHIMU